jgi:hypothetical protein
MRSKDPKTNLSLFPAGPRPLVQWGVGVNRWRVSRACGYPLRPMAKVVHAGSPPRSCVVSRRAYPELCAFPDVRGR